MTHAMNRKALSLSLLLLLSLLILFALLLTSLKKPPHYNIVGFEIDSENFVHTVSLNNHGAVLGQIDLSSRKRAGTKDGIAVAEGPIDRRAVVWRDGESIDIGTLGGEDVSPTAVNDAGQVVGSSSIAGGTSHAFFWSEETGMVDLNDPGDEWGRVWDINNAGQVVGEVANHEGKRYGFVWSTTRETPLPMAGNQQTKIRSAFGINNKGQVVGLAETEGRPDCAVIWDNRERMTLLSPPQDGLDCLATSITDTGKVVGKCTTSSKAWLAVLWDGGQNLSLCPRFRTCTPRLAINDRGQIVGFDAPWPADLPSLIVRLRGFLSGRELTAGLAVTVDGLFDCGVNSNRGFLWEDGVYYSLLDLVPPDSGWSFLFPSDINEAGQIVGDGVKDGRLQSFLMTSVSDDEPEKK
jgi:probable HAF family extracellular repeat protein